MLLIGISTKWTRSWWLSTSEVQSVNTSETLLAPLVEPREMDNARVISLLASD